MMNALTPCQGARRDPHREAAMIQPKAPGLQPNVHSPRQEGQDKKTGVTIVRQQEPPEVN